jgi:hypothetical protein
MRAAGRDKRLIEERRRQTVDSAINVLIAEGFQESPTAASTRPAGCPSTVKSDARIDP